MSNIPEMADNKMSRQKSEYYMNAVNVMPDIPVFSYGMPQTRQAESLPESLVDVESRLNNRYDIIGKAGYVYKKDGERIEDHMTVPKVQPIKHSELGVEKFFSQVAGRDMKAPECSSSSFWRDDIVTIQRPEFDRYPHVDTRLQSKDKINDCF